MSRPAVNWTQAAVKDPRHRRDAQQRVELAGAVERREVVAAADMVAVDEDLRHGACGRRRARSSRRAAPAPRRRRSRRRSTPLRCKQRPRPRAIAAEHRRYRSRLRPCPTACPVARSGPSCAAIICLRRATPAPASAHRPPPRRRACSTRAHSLDASRRWSTRRRPAGALARDLRPGARAESAGDVARARAAGCACPATGCGGGAPASRRATGGPPAPRERLRQHRRLVVAAREKPRPMQRHRHQQIGLGEKLAAGAPHPARRSAGARCEPVAMLEGQDQPAAVVVVAQRRARAVAGAAARGRSRRTARRRPIG